MKYSPYAFPKISEQFDLFPTRAWHSNPVQNYPAIVKIKAIWGYRKDEIHKGEARAELGDVFTFLVVSCISLPRSFTSSSFNLQEVNNEAKFFHVIHTYDFL